MEFTYSAYKGLIRLLKDEGYMVTNYHDYSACKEETDIVILRHDIDSCVEKACKMAQLEEELGIRSTYFVLVTSEFYNIAAKRNATMLREIHAMGHEIGLHFDEMCYEGKGLDEMVIMAEKEMESDISFPSMINSYSSTFYKEFKYLSDSRMHWRENAEEIIKAHNYHCLHILTHAFWYAESEWGGYGRSFWNSSFMQM